MKEFIKKYNRIFIVFFGCIRAVILFFVSMYLIFSYSYTPLIYEKNKFSQEDINIISERLHIDIEDENIDVARFSHAKDSDFYFKVTDMALTDIDTQYYVLCEDHSTYDDRIRYVHDGGNNDTGL